jgi:Spy/CpxP family protein refolding chaperone
MRAALRYLVILAFSASPAFAQMPGTIAWWNSPIARDLGLTDQQNQQIRVTVREARAHLVQLQGTVQVAEAELRDEMNQERVDPHKAGDAIEKVVAARSELMRSVSQLALRLRLILTPAQWQELQKREVERPRQQMRRGLGPLQPLVPGDRRPRAGTDGPLKGYE